MIESGHSPLLSAIIRWARITPHKIAMIDGDCQVTYGELVNHIVYYAKLLQSSGVSQDDRVLIAANKDTTMIYTYFAAHLLGAVNVVVDRALPKERLEFIINKTTPRLVLGISHSIQEDINTLQPIMHELVSPTNLSPDDIADIMFTTGTTGTPKGVCLSHANIFGAASNINGFIGNNSHDIEVLGLPLSHSFGLGRMRCTLLAGGTLVLLGNFANLKCFFEAIEKHKATGFGMVPAVWQYIKKISGTRIGKYANQLRYIEIGSAAMDIADKQLLMELFPCTRICMHYGLTEASRAFFMEFHENADKLNSIGKPVSQHVEAMIFGQDHEICVKGNMVLKSYLDEKDNKGAFVDGYFRTGDYGMRDQKGYYYLQGRLKEIINIGGKKVNPTTIEDAIIKAGATDCAVVPIPDPNSVLGEVPMAFIVTKGRILDEIKEETSKHLEPYQVPMRWKEVDNIPRTSSGKIQRLSLKQKYKL